MTSSRGQISFIGTLGSLWGLSGVSLLLGSAVYRLGIYALDAFAHEFLWHHWISLALIILFMAYAEGYKGFQQRFSPRVAARARYLRRHGGFFNIALAPLFCMGFFHATRRRKITSYSLTTGIILLVISVRYLRQPWRGIVDTGVVIGLLWGLVSLLYFSVLALTAESFTYSPEVPEQ